MKTQTVFQNSSLVSVINGSIVIKDSNGGEHTFVNASVVSVNNGTIIIESEWKPKKGELAKVTNTCIDAYCIIDKIVDGQVSEGYFKECPITFKDIAMVKALFKEKLKTVYHTRITYPELKK